VNYYEHHLGDYDGATAHLSWLEDCAYRRLICLYYRNEVALPSDLKQVCRLARAASKQERDAVAQVLGEFFVLEEDGWHHKRCDEEIRRYQERSAKARASVAKRWAARDANVGRSGYEPDTDVIRTYNDGSTNDIHRAPVPSHQTPDTKHQNQEAAHSEVTTEPPPETVRSAPPEVPNPPPTDPPGTSALTRHGEIAVLLRSLGVVANSMHPTVHAWATADVPDHVIREAVELARSRGQTRIGVRYLEGIVEDLRSPKPRREQSPAWWSSERATEAQARALGLTARGGESWEEFRGRIRTALARTGADA